MPKNITSTEKLLQVYKQALTEAQLAESSEDKIAAFSRVTDFCRTPGACENVMEDVRAMILFWSYRQLGDIAYEMPDKDREAVVYYQNAFQLAPGNAEKLAVGKKIAAICLRTGDDENLREMLKILAGIRDNDKEISRFIALAETAENPSQKHRYLENAWQAANCSHDGEVRQCQVIFDMLDGLKNETAVPAIGTNPRPPAVQPRQS